MQLNRFDLNLLNEVIRLESPIRGFGRQATQNYEIDGVVLRVGDRVQDRAEGACATRGEVLD
jgi:hypothetical protein